MSGEVHPLSGNQLRAVDPGESIWLSASAGTGKTQVLSARVLRLLLQSDVDPSQILCLTFTKAGAAEMAVRINAVLARWVRLDDIALQRELEHLGAPYDPATRERARTLFAAVLDCPGGGLRIDTIHAFSQWLLASFPTEAELIPGARPMEDRERESLSREVLADLLVAAGRNGEHGLLDTVRDFVRRKDAEALRAWLMRCANAHELWREPGGWRAPMRPRVLQLLGLPSDADEAALADLCAAGRFDDAALGSCLAEYRGWKAKTADEAIPAIERWLASAAPARVEQIEMLREALFYKNGNPKLPKNPAEAFAEAIARVGQSLQAIADFRTLLELADFVAPALELGRSFALAWDAAKTREGLLDFEDLIQRAAALLTRREAADWIRFKLDRRFDHILVDEAQDTNAAQWRIIDGLIDDFFAGEGAQGDRLRTIFTVGDTKQAIFGFQGTSPENFEAARLRVKAAMHGAADNAASLRRNRLARELQELDLGQSFRTARPVLEFVDAAIAALGHEALGLKDHHPHVGQDRPGLVTLWNPVRDGRDAAPDDADGETSEGSENWLARHDRSLAERIAEQVRRWVSGEQPFGLVKNRHRNAAPGDIMVLVRKRKELAALIVARLHARGVPVAGVDRLRLGAPLAVRDLMAALRFAAQPLDDLNLANLLASPLLGWSQDDLLAHVPRDEGKRLWHHLRDLNVPRVAQAVASLRELLARADFAPPDALLHWMLVGPWQGRRKLLARLGREAGDPIDELVNAAISYAAVHTPSLVGFIHWFDASQGELKRDPGETPDLVRVMTVHGAKGLQAPIVILADATGKPGDIGDLELAEHLPGSDEPRLVPVPSVRKEERAGPLEAAHGAAEVKRLQEHWRLLYVAMTRAEEALFIAGSLGPREKEPHADSWFARLAPLFGEEALADDLWDGRSEWGNRAPPADIGRDEASAVAAGELPRWALTPIGPEPRPPRPLAPSGAGEEQGADPPLPPEQARAAARRGVLIHRLLERLPELEPEVRAKAAQSWLERQARDLAAHEREEIAARTLAVIAEPGFADVFGPQALAEVPLAATVGGEVIAGVADRLLVTAETITVVDFKTARRPPAALEQIPESTARQMAAYVAALEAIYPGRIVRAAVLYTQTPQIFLLPQALVELHKGALHRAQQSFSSAGVE